MARDTSGSVPGATSDLRRVSVDAPHWHTARWLLAAEAFAAAMVGGAGLLGVFLIAPSGFSVFGIPLTVTLSSVMLGLAAAAAVAVTRRRLALLFCAAVSTSAVGLMVIAAVAGAHHASGPMGFTSTAILLWAALFCYNFALGFWLVPDHIEGPAWVPRLGKAGSANDPKREPG
jgi:hypothetical protein